MINAKKSFTPSFNVSYFIIRSLRVIIEAVIRKNDIKKALLETVKDYGEGLVPHLEIPELKNGDFTTNLALVLASKHGQNPLDLANEICEKLRKSLGDGYQVEVKGPGFINIWLAEKDLFGSLSGGHSSESLSDKKLLVEYAHPNTHKEMHIGHMRTLITGESLTRIFESNGAKVFRANYQGDIGPHVAKALYGVEKLLKEEGADLESLEGKNPFEKADFLGRAYVVGNEDYGEHKEEIDKINEALYKKDSAIMPLYEITRRWSLEYYDEFYKLFYAKFDRLFFESEMVESGKKIVEENVGKVFRQDNGAIIFPGEEYGLHTRVFVTQAGNPTYEGKEMGNGFAEYDAFPFDEKIHVVGSEQTGYFQVVFKALSLIDPEKFDGKQRHISMGMVTFTDRKMSSRTGDILRVDHLIDEVKKRIEAMVEEGRIEGENKDEVVEMVAVGAIKYSVLKVGTGQNVAFDIEKSVSLEGDSGPYLQYTYARTQSVLVKAKSAKRKAQSDLALDIGNLELEIEESDLLRFIYRFSDTVEEAGRNYSPNILADYLFDLSKLYNNFYQKHKIIGSEKEAFRLALTKASGDALRGGLDLLGIKAPPRM